MDYVHLFQVITSLNGLTSSRRAFSGRSASGLGLAQGRPNGGRAAVSSSVRWGTAPSAPSWTFEPRHEACGAAGVESAQPGVPGVQTSGLSWADCSLGQRLDSLSTCGPDPWAGGRCVPLRKENVMRKVREVDAAVTALRRLLASRESQLGSGERLRRLLGKLEAMAKGGRASRSRTLKVIAEITEVVCGEFLRK